MDGNNARLSRWPVEHLDGNNARLRRFRLFDLREPHHARLLEQTIPTVPQIQATSGRGHGVPDNFPRRQNLDTRRRGLGRFQQPAAFRHHGVGVGGFVASMATTVALGIFGTNVDLVYTVYTVYRVSR